MNLNLIKKLTCIISLIILSVSSLSAKDFGYFNSLAVGAGVTTNGIGVNVATPVGNYLALRAGANFMPNFTLNTSVNANATVDGTQYSGEVDLEGGIKRIQGEFLLNFYPIKRCSFFITAGAFFGGDKIVSITGHSDELEELMQNPNVDKAGIVIGDQEIPVDEHGNISGGLKVKKFRPYVGLGYGRAIPNSRINFMIEAGVQFHGTAKVFTDYGELDFADNNIDDTFTKIVDNWKVYPVLRIGFNIRLF